MMSASAMSAAIRAKKKKMEMDEGGAVKLSGIPEDAGDIMVVKNHEATDSMNDNDPKERDEDPSLESLHADTVAAQPHEEKAPDPMDGDSEEKKLKMAKIGKMIARMGSK